MAASPKITLIATLGTSSPVITETLDVLLSQGIVIQKLKVIHTLFPAVLENKIQREDGTSMDIGLNALCSYLKKNYKQLQTVTIPVGQLQDIYTEEDNALLFNTLAREIALEKSAGNTVYLSIAGGRKTMSALGLLAGYLFGADHIYHVLAGDKDSNDIALNKRYGFEVPLEKLKLIKLPAVNLSGLMATLNRSPLSGSDNYFGFVSGALNSGVFNLNKEIVRINAEVEHTANRQKWRENYDKMYPLLDRFVNAMGIILKGYVYNTPLLILPTLEYRVKKFDSLEEKALKNNIEDPFGKFNDLCGARLISTFPQDKWALVRAVLEHCDISDIAAKKIREAFDEKKSNISFQEWKDYVIPVIESPSKKGKDFILLSFDEKKRPFAYHSVHFDLTFSKQRLSLNELSGLKGIIGELQIRTAYEHLWSDPEHKIRYKGEESRSEEVRNKINERLTEAMVHLKSVEKTMEEIYKLLKSGSDDSST